jgi:DNA-binding transcriptional MerR regulator
VSDKVENTSYSLAGLAEETGLPRRTIRYYIARGLLPGPMKAGRGSEYSREHLDRLREIQRLQKQGRTLAEVAQQLAGGDGEAALPKPRAMLTYVIAPDVTVQVEAGASPWRLKQIRTALGEFAARLAPEGESPDADNNA